MRPSFFHLLAALAVLTFVGVGYGFWYRIVAGESARSAGLAQQIETKKETAKRASAVQTALTELESDEGAVEDYFVSEKNIVAFLGRLESLGSGIGAKVTVASVGALSGAGQTLSVALGISGSFDVVMRTVGAIEYAPYAITVSSFTMAKGEGASGVLWHANLVVGVGSTATGATTVPKAAPPAPLPEL